MEYKTARMVNRGEFVVSNGNAATKWDAKVLNRIVSLTVSIILHKTGRFSRAQLDMLIAGKWI